MKRVVSIVLCICTWSGVVAQDWAKVSAAPKDERLKVGDRLPFDVLHNMINYPKKDLKFSDHKPKLILLDFWGTQCTPCIAAWPKLLELQKEFGKDLLIVPIDKYENEKRIRDFVAKRKRIYHVDMNLPMAAKDSTIWKYFPAMDVPRYYWIDSNYRIRAITLGGELNSENIRKWIQSGPFELTQVVSKTWKQVTPFEPIFVNGNGGERSSDVFIWSSSLTKGQTDVPAAPHIYYDSILGYGITITGTSILGLYGTAYNNRNDYSQMFDYLHWGRTELIAKDTMKFYVKRMGGANYNYQLLCGAPKSREELLAMMKDDLKRYFQMDVSWEKRTKKCLVFSMVDSTLAKGKRLGCELSIKDMGIAIDSIPVGMVITNMELSTPYRLLRYPIVDATGYKGILTGIRAEGNANDPVEFDKMLSKFGMRLKFEMREVDVLVLREPKSTP
jgi:thiol-disulfide isomerase/thioredoxin